MAQISKRLITAEDLYRFQVITAQQISPDGQQVVYAVQRVDKKNEKKYINLWMAPVHSGEPVPFTTGDQTDVYPKWSPDGQRIAFLSNRGSENQSQLYVIPFGGGEALKITDLQGEFGEFEWSPNGKQLIMQFRKKDAEAIEREQDEQKKKLGIVSRRYSRMFYKLDGYGYLPKERWHLWVVDVRTKRARQLTEGDVYDESNPVWSPDGKQIAFFSNRSPNPDLEYEKIDLYVYDLRDGSTRKIDTPLGPKSMVAFSPDGESIAYIARDGIGDEWKNDNLWIVPLNDSKPAHNLTGTFDIHVSAWTINDIGASAQMAPVWAKDSKSIYFQVARNGSTTLNRIDIEGNNLETIIPAPGVVASFSFDQDQSVVSYHWGTFTDPGQILAKQLNNPEPAHRLTHLNQDWLAEIDLGEIEEVWFKGAANNDLQGWILKPPSFDSSRKYPSILEIHGGPLVQYGNFFMHEFYYLAAQGFVVFFCNPRGGQGYGEEHARAIHGNWGGVDYDDLMLWADLMLQKSYIDPERMGVTGGSYGGYMTNWIIGHTHRFAAAVTQRSVSNLISMWGSSDYNWSFQETFDNKAPYESIDGLWKCSPVRYLGGAKTPTLVIHNEQDMRCDLEQGEQVFIALKKQGVPAEFVIFPDEPHGLSRTGRTDRRIVRLKSICGWFDQYLK